MEGFIYFILVIAAIICGILNGILFWKIWHMCDDVKAMRNEFVKENETEQVPEQTVYDDNLPFHVGDTVRIDGTFNEVEIIQIKNNKYCVNLNGKSIWYNENEIKHIK